MRKKILGLAVVTMLTSAGICGCRKAPESSADGEILHAKDSAESEVEAIINESGSEMENERQEIDCMIGRGDHAIRIQAQTPKVPPNVRHIVLGENEALTKGLLMAFLESETGNIEDLSEIAQKELEQFQAENERAKERAVFSVFGSAPVYELSDGQKTAGFFYGTGAYYQNEPFCEKCASVYKSAEETVLEEADHAKVYKKAEKILSAKLSKIGMDEIAVYRITQYAKGDVTFYEIGFTPSYGGMGLVHEFGSIAAGEIFPSGTAWICEGRIAYLNMENCLGKAETQEKCGTLLSWGQIERILETYVKSGKINGSDQMVLTEVEFLYYPIFKEEENKLELVPVWHIYTPMSAWLEKEEAAEAVTNGAAWSVCVNAESGEIVRSE